MGVIPWYPLAGGFLTGKYRRGEAPAAGTRFSSNPALYGRMLNEANFDYLDKLRDFASERHHSVAELAISWLLSHPQVSTVIAGVTKKEQVSANVASAEWKLKPEDMAELDRITNFKVYSIFGIGPRKYSLPAGYLKNK
jgi:aryl-alcohol dehydrogenase-like predicted oxidoreductase